MKDLNRTAGGRKLLRKRLTIIKGKLRCEFKEIPNSILFYRIIETAIDDLIVNGKDCDHWRRLAQSYLGQPEIHAAAVCGIETAWIHRLFKEAGLQDYLGGYRYA